MSTNSLSSYKALSFDIYGTLIDWESGINRVLQQLSERLPDSHPCKHSKDASIAAFNRYETSLMRDNPTMLYDEVLKRTYLLLAKEWGVEGTEQEAETTFKSIADWKAFPDTVAAMQALGRKYKLVALSNITNALFAKTKSGPLKDVEFDAVYAAENIGSYKPDRRNFEYLLDGVQRDLGVAKQDLLHVAHGVTSDQVPAEDLGLAHVWIKRGKDNWGDVPKMQGLLEFETLGDLAKAAGCS